MEWTYWIPNIKHMRGQCNQYMQTVDLYWKMKILSRRMILDHHESHLDALQSLEQLHKHLRNLDHKMEQIECHLRIPPTIGRPWNGPPDLIPMEEFSHFWTCPQQWWCSNNSSRSSIMVQQWIRPPPWFLYCSILELMCIFFGGCIAIWEGPAASTSRFRLLFEI